MVAVKCFTSPDRKGGFSEEVRMWFSDHGFNFLSSSSESIPFPSLVPRPHPHKEKGLVSIERFLGCSELAVFIQNKPLNETTLRHKDIQDCWLGTTKDALNSHQTLFFVRVWGLGTRQTSSPDVIVCLFAVWNDTTSTVGVRLEKLSRGRQKSMVESLGQHH